VAYVKIRTQADLVFEPHTYTGLFARPYYTCVHDELDIQARVIAKLREQLRELTKPNNKKD